MIEEERRDDARTPRVRGMMQPAGRRRAGWGAAMQQEGQKSIRMQYIYPPGRQVYLPPPRSLTRVRREGSMDCTPSAWDCAREAGGSRADDGRPGRGRRPPARRSSSLDSAAAGEEAK